MLDGKSQDRKREDTKYTTPRGHRLGRGLETDYLKSSKHHELES